MPKSHIRREGPRPSRACRYHAAAALSSKSANTEAPAEIILCSGCLTPNTEKMIDSSPAQVV